MKLLLSLLLGLFAIVAGAKSAKPSIQIRKPLCKAGEQTARYFRPAIAAILFAWMASSAAELPPHAYIAAAQSAPEAVRIKVLAVSKDTSAGGTAVELQGEVIEVRRSQSGLAPGMRFDVRYYVNVRNPDVVGPGPPDIPVVGAVVPAFLQKNIGDDTYVLSARGASFSQWVWDESARPSQ